MWGNGNGSGSFTFFVATASVCTLLVLGSTDKRPLPKREDLMRSLLSNANSEVKLPCNAHSAEVDGQTPRKSGCGKFHT